MSSSSAGPGSLPGACCQQMPSRKLLYEYFFLFSSFFLSWSTSSTMMNITKQFSAPGCCSNYYNNAMAICVLMWHLKDRTWWPKLFGLPGNSFNAWQNEPQCIVTRPIMLKASWTAFKAKVFFIICNFLLGNDVIRFLCFDLLLLWEESPKRIVSSTRGSTRKKIKSKNCGGIWRLWQMSKSCATFVTYAILFLTLVCYVHQRKKVSQENRNFQYVQQRHIYKVESLPSPRIKKLIFLRER